MQPERALRLLDSLDGLAFAARLAWPGYWGRRLRVGGIAAAAMIGVAIGHAVLA